MLQILVPGDLISTNADQFRAGSVCAMDAHAANNSEWAGVEFDLTAARMVDSAGLNAIISLIRKLNEEGKRARIHVRNSHVYRVCMFTRLDRLAEVIRS
jgi:ABC-type transporter Mla MlaB component